MRTIWPNQKGSRTPLLERLWDKISPEPNSGCWLFIGSLTRDGYGSIGVETALQGLKTKRAHRAAYELLRAPIPAGFELHHRCQVRCCVNPDHLQFVTGKLNVQQIKHRRPRKYFKTQCPHGHEYTLENTYFEGRRRRCRLCRAAYKHRWKQRQKARAETELGREKS